MKDITVPITINFEKTIEGLVGTARILEHAHDLLKSGEYVLSPGIVIKKTKDGVIQDSELIELSLVHKSLIEGKNERN